MILAVSRFKVANGLEADVAKAFLRRPRLVDRAPGFLGLETFTEEKDCSIFYLVTRWTDTESFHAWHRSDAHHHSHEFIPRGLKLDASYTQLVLLDRLSSPDETPTLEEVTADGLPVLLWFLDQASGFCLASCARDGTIVACNEGLKRRLGVKDLRGRRLWEVLTEPDASQVRARVTHGERLSGERFLLNFVDSEHAPFTLRCLVDVQPDSFLLVGEPTFREDEILQHELLRLNNDLATAHRESQRRARDLEVEVRRRETAEKRLADLNAELEARVRERTRELEDFSYTVAHNLRAPLRATSGLCQLLEDDYSGKILDETGTDYARRAGEQARRLDALIQDLLEYSSLNRAVLKRRPVDPSEPIAVALRRLDPQIRISGARVEVESPLPTVLAHKATLERVFFKLVSNTLRFTFPGHGARVRIRSESKPPIVRLWVEDEGVGIEDEHKERIFGVFEQLGGGPGTGMGLAFVKRAVELMGGRVGVESEPGKGSRFFMDLERGGDDADSARGG